jgi:streptogramin lyase
MRTRRTYSLVGAARPLAGLGALAFLLAGCATNSGPDTATSAPIPVPATHAVSGSVYGGQQPVSGATIQLYSVATTSKGSASPLISATVTTTSNGTFTITGDYSCSGNPLVYIVATGGNPGGGANSALSLMAALGPCNNLTPSTFISINELTTVASVYALAPYMSGYKNVGAATTNTAGLTNAFLTVNSLVNTATGSAPGPGLPGTGIVPAAELNTLANILSSCVNSTGIGPACTSLFSATTPSGGSSPSDTIGAALNIATHPGSNVATLFSLTTATPPFVPTLTTVPNDWTVAIKYVDPSLSSPYGLAIDASGNVWVTNETGASVTKLSGIGAVLSGATGFTGGGLLGPKGIAIDRTGNAWIANAGGSSVVDLSSSGSVLSGTSGFTAGGIDAPVAIALDSHSNVWIANFSSNSVTVLTSAGLPYAASPLTDSGAIASPNGIAIDKNGYGWVSNSGANNLIFIQNSGASFFYSQYTDNAIQGSSGIAVDTNSNKWVAATGINAISLFSGFAGANALSPIRAAGLTMPAGVATDGSNNVWVTNGSISGTLSELSSTGTLLSPATGFGSLNTPVSIGVDPSGSVWTANLGDNSVSEFVGIAAPATTPLAAVAGP